MSQERKDVQWLDILAKIVQVYVLGALLQKICTHLKFTYIELVSFIRDNIMPIPEFILWNERKNGNKSPYGFVSRYTDLHPDDDFIDLDALIRNIANDIVREKHEVAIPDII